MLQPRGAPRIVRAHIEERSVSGNHDLDFIGEAAFIASRIGGCCDVVVGLTTGYGAVSVCGDFPRLTRWRESSPSANLRSGSARQRRDRGKISL